MSKMNIIFIILGLLWMSSGLAAIIYSTLKNKKHKLLCDAFYERFGFLPGGIILAQAGGIFFAFQKDFYFLFPLIVSKDNFIVRSMDLEHYDFIRALPREMTLWIKVKFILLAISIILMIATSVIYYIFIKV